MAHNVKVTFNEVSPAKMAQLETTEAEFEKISDTQVTIECSSEDEADVRAFMAAPVDEPTPAPES
jgi:hypothetical protein